MQKLFHPTILKLVAWSSKTMSQTKQTKQCAVRVYVRASKRVADLLGRVWRQVWQIWTNKKS